MQRADLLDEAKRIVTQDRNKQHGEPENLFGAIAAYWTEFLDMKITPDEVALMMVLFKVARAKSGKNNIDNYLDMVGYGAIAGELASEENRGNLLPEFSKTEKDSSWVETVAVWQDLDGEEIKVGDEVYFSKLVVGNIQDYKKYKTSRNFGTVKKIAQDGVIIGDSGEVFPFVLKKI